MNISHNLGTAPGQSVGHQTEHSTTRWEWIGSQPPVGWRVRAWRTWHPSENIAAFAYAAAEPADG